MRSSARRRKSSLNRFYLISPRQNTDADSFIEKLLSLKPVQEVFLTDGDFGYIVKAKFRNGRAPDDIVDSMAKKMDSKFGKAVSYYQYTK
ncbi:MAG TPA: Lrp/AsnC ligand binding domain-containing protein [Candidatus Acidoferrum sp.]|nr:Lrp/AsnC ligand binding domain-containing protein [Candidatus Acidoferrum sp.]